MEKAQRVHGKGKAVLRAYGTEVAFEEMSYTYPLKLLSPKTSASKPIAIVYAMSYGGGLVGGDHIDLEIDVGAAAGLVVLTQVMHHVPCLSSVVDKLSIALPGIH